MNRPHILRLIAAPGGYVAVQKCEVIISTYCTSEQVNSVNYPSTAAILEYNNIATPLKSVLLHAALAYAFIYAYTPKVNAYLDHLSKKRLHEIINLNA